MASEGLDARTSEFQVGIAAIAAAAFLLLVGIPHGVTTPSNIRNVVLSPTFWPQILAGLLALAGICLLISAPPAAPREDESALVEIRGGPRLPESAWRRATTSNGSRGAGIFDGLYAYYQNNRN